MRHLLIMLNVLCTVHVASTSAQDARGSVMQEAVNHLSREIVKGPVTIDPRVLLKGGPIPKADEGPPHGSALLGSVAVEGVSTLATLAHAVSCQNAAASHCKTEGRAAFVMMSVPTVNGDSAKLEVFFRQARNLNAADSARIRAAHIRGEAQMRASGYRGPAFNIYDSTKTFDRMEMPSGTKYEFSLAQVGGAWTVIAMRILGQT